MKEHSTFSRSIGILAFALVLIISGCASSKNSSNNHDGNNYTSRSKAQGLSNVYSVSGQHDPPSYIQSIQLYKSGNMGAAPIINLNNGESVTLEFDYMDTEARQFTVQVTHRTPEWQKSILARNFYQKGLFQDNISSSYLSRAQDPTYQHYTYTIPNDNIQFKVSGNYLLTVTDSKTGNTVFSLPFFVYEDEGQLQTSIQSIPAPANRIYRYQQLFGTFSIPEFVTMPQFDLSFYFVQNQFWGRYKKVNIVQSIQDKVDFHLARDEAFIADYGFKYLDLTELSADGINILDYQPGKEPPHIILRRDIQDLSPSIDADRTTRHGFPRNDRSAKYARVFFYLETAVKIQAEDKIYVVGDFNNWNIRKENKLEYNIDEKAWVGDALIKQGRYTYKYILVRNGEVQDMVLNNSFSLARQQYFGLVYFEDPDMNFMRLLQVQSMQSN